MTPVSNPLFVAKEVQNMAKNSHGAESIAFQRGAVVMMGAMVAASVAGVLLQLVREFRHHDNDRGR